ncbi:MAG: acyl carrier protein [Pseudomonadota bacterium]
MFEETFEEQNEGSHAPELGGDTVLLETGMDSLGFAILVAKLEEELGYDPFSLSDEAYYPVTYDEFLDFYADNCPA